MLRSSNEWALRGLFFLFAKLTFSFMKGVIVMIKNIRLNFYNLLFSWHMNRGMFYSKKASKYIHKSNRLAAKAEKYINKMIRIAPELDEEL